MARPSASCARSPNERVSLSRVAELRRPAAARPSPRPAWCLRVRRGRCGRRGDAAREQGGVRARSVRPALAEGRVAARDRDHGARGTGRDAGPARPGRPRPARPPAGRARRSARCRVLPGRSSPSRSPRASRSRRSPTSRRGRSGCSSTCGAARTWSRVSSGGPARPASTPSSSRSTCRSSETASAMSGTASRCHPGFASIRPSTRCRGRVGCTSSSAAPRSRSPTSGEIAGSSDPGAIGPFVDRELNDPTATWERLDGLRRLWDGPLVVKGCSLRTMPPRRFGAAPTPSTSPTTAAASSTARLRRSTCSPPSSRPSADRAEVLLDGGVRRGEDVVKARALGARACLVGRPWFLGLAAGGRARRRAHARRAGPGRRPDARAPRRAEDRRRRHGHPLRTIVW